MWEAATAESLDRDVDERSIKTPSGKMARYIAQVAVTLQVGGPAAMTPCVCTAAQAQGARRCCTAAESAQAATRIRSD